jgi:hypothetical protein
MNDDTTKLLQTATFKASSILKTWDVSKPLKDTATDACSESP